jgi:uncharacterized alpha-E superfamily protein
VNELARATILPDNSRLSRVVGRLQSNLSYDEVEEVFDVDFHTYLNNIRQQIHQIHDVLYSTFISYSIDNALK